MDLFAVDNIHLQSADVIAVIGVVTIGCLIFLARFFWRRKKCKHQLSTNDQFDDQQLHEHLTTSLNNLKSSLGATISESEFKASFYHLLSIRDHSVHLKRQFMSEQLTDVDNDAAPLTIQLSEVVIDNTQYYQVIGIVQRYIPTNLKLKFETVAHEHGVTSFRYIFKNFDEMTQTDRLVLQTFISQVSRVISYTKVIGSLAIVNGAFQLQIRSSLTAALENSEIAAQTPRLQQIRKASEKLSEDVLSILLLL